jgi:hypothetical protein
MSIWPYRSLSSSFCSSLSFGDIQKRIFSNDSVFSILSCFGGSFGTACINRLISVITYLCGVNNFVQSLSKLKALYYVGRELAPSGQKIHLRKSAAKLENTLEEPRANGTQHPSLH